MSDSSERRNFPRSSVQLPVRVKSGGEEFSGAVCDLTVEGLAFTLEGSLTPGSRVEVEFKTGGEPIQNNTLQAEILRCEPAENPAPHPYRISARLIEANDQFLMDALALVHGKQS